jgi:hypothetical protein
MYTSFLQVTIATTNATWSTDHACVYLQLPLGTRPQIKWSGIPAILEENPVNWDITQAFHENLVAIASSRIDRTTPFATVTHQGADLPISNFRVYGDTILLEVRDQSIRPRGRGKVSPQHRLWYYKGLGFTQYRFSSDVPHLADAIQLFCKEDRVYQEGVHAAHGFIIPYPKPPDCFQGGLSIELYSNPALQSYIQESINKEGYATCLGYLGNSNRRAGHDRILEDFMRSVLDWSSDQIAAWMTSGQGRHFADSYEGIDSLTHHIFTDFSVDPSPAFSVHEDQRQTVVNKYGPLFLVEEHAFRQRDQAIAVASGSVFVDTEEKAPQGGFSDALWGPMQDQITPAGYFIHPSRLVRHDRLVEAILHTTQGDLLQINDGAWTQFFPFVTSDYALCAHPLWGTIRAGTIREAVPHNLKV